jgi:molecular chaperone GrpE (heat shock protein)
MEENKKKEADSRSRAMTLTIKAVVLNKKNEILILKRSQNNKFSLGKYDLPGGHIEVKESLKDSILREIKEETGLDTVFGEIIDVVEFLPNSPQFKEEKRGIRCICYSESTEVKLSPEHEKFEWIPIEKAPNRFSEDDGFENEKRNTILKAQKYLEMKNSLDGWKRCRADFENYKKRQDEERIETIAYSSRNLILELLPILDNFHASTDHIPPDQKDNAWVTGIMHIQKQLEKILEDGGVSEIKVKIGDEFNPEMMEALENKECPPEECKNIVKKIVIKGYRLNGKVIRVAKVIVE